MNLADLERLFRPVYWSTPLSLSRVLLWPSWTLILDFAAMTNHLPIYTALAVETLAGAILDLNLLTSPQNKPSTSSDESGTSCPCVCAQKWSQKHLQHKLVNRLVLFSLQRSVVKFHQNLATHCYFSVQICQHLLSLSEETNQPSERWL